MTTPDYSLVQLKDMAEGRARGPLGDAASRQEGIDLLIKKIQELETQNSNLNATVEWQVKRLHQADRYRDAWDVCFHYCNQSVATLKPDYNIEVYLALRKTIVDLSNNVNPNPVAVISFTTAEEAVSKLKDASAIAEGMDSDMADLEPVRDIVETKRKVLGISKTKK